MHEVVFTARDLVAALPDRSAHSREIARPSSELGICCMVLPTNEKAAIQGHLL